MSVSLSEDLTNFITEFIPERFDELVETYSKPLPETFRVNTLKTTVDECLDLLGEEAVECKPVRWTRLGFYAEPPGRLSKSLWHLLGLVYIQGPVSMLVSELLDVRPGERVLDLCAAPGSKSTHIGQSLAGRGVLVANDVSRTRIKALTSNLQRCGVLNCVVTLADGRYLGFKMPDYFDRVLVDAPCSSLGVAAKDWSILKKWSSKLSERMGRLQKSLLFSGFRALKPGGQLVYATCTYHPLENEAVVSALLDEFENAALVDIQVNGLSFSRGVECWRRLSFRDEVKKAIRIYPFQSGAEGFFIAKVVKKVA
ncbi:MAG: RsmB/NOP family class I SAM-dependent RNA methyltransferase [Candidatus Caldarchaeum sp.]|uniref:RsmB/NOP family class I SAM-dependent RNA methyltransferase n=1 Tax=Caldiarchaeum subterraneum TaxID=311458 RepID=A0A7C5LC45_CALS0